MKTQAVTRKPKLDTDAAKAFANPGRAMESVLIEAYADKPAPSAAKYTGGAIPDGDVRLTANIKRSLHLKLKIAAAEQRTTIGELLENLIEAHFNK